MAHDQFENAALWRLRKDEPLSDDETAEFDAWKARPRNAEDYELVERALAAFDGEGNLALRRLRNETRARVRRGKFVRIASALAASIVVAIGAAIFLQRPTISTFDNEGMGPRNVALKDGSQVVLDSGARVRVAYSSRARSVELIGGQASFEVARDAVRPFSVRFGEASAVALGTRFNVNRWGDGATVTLVEGRLAVRPSSDSEGVVLASGQRVTWLHGRLSPVYATSPGLADAATRWQQGLLVFDNERLDEAVVRVNRYSRRPVVLSSPDLGALRISGTFKAGDVDAFSRGVSVLHHLALEPGPGEVTLSGLN